MSLFWVVINISSWFILTMQDCKPPQVLTLTNTYALETVQFSILLWILSTETGIHIWKDETSVTTAVSIQPFHTRTFFFVGTGSGMRRARVTFITDWSILVHIFLFRVHFAINTWHFQLHAYKFSVVYKAITQKQNKTVSVELVQNRSD